MIEKSKLTPLQWVEVLANKELPAITSMASVLESFSNDDISSIPKLSKAILHDQALSSCVLRVANSSRRPSFNKVNTVSRAAIQLGIQAIKNICLTAKILDGLLHKSNLTPRVYERLMRLTANAFYAGMLARVMLQNDDEGTQEEVYLSAMLFHIGETSFWSTGSELTKSLIKKSHLPESEFQKYCAATLGVSFKDLSVGLAKTWNLSDLLINSIEHPENGSNEMKIINYATQLTGAISSPPKTEAEFDKLLVDISSFMKIDVVALKKKIEQSRQEALELLKYYGANQLENYFNPLPTSQDFNQTKIRENKTSINITQARIAAMQNLTELTKSKNTISNYISQALQDAVKVFDLDRCSFWVLNTDKTELETRLNFDAYGLPMKFNATISVNQAENLLSHALSQSQSILINDYKHSKWRNYMTGQVVNLIDKGTMSITPVKIGEKKIGVITAHTFNQSNPITEENYAELSLLFDHLNRYLSTITSKK